MLQVDRPAATQSRCDAVSSQLFDLFASLGADDRQLDFPVLYASAKQVRGVGGRGGGGGVWWGTLVGLGCMLYASACHWRHYTTSERCCQQLEAVVCDPGAIRL
jgi:hypothetical protein